MNDNFNGIKSSGLAVHSGNEQTLHRNFLANSEDKEGGVWINYRGLPSGKRISAYLMGDGSATNSVTDVILKDIIFRHKTSSYFACEQVYEEQNTNIDWVKTYFSNMPGGIRFVYNNHSREWTYIFSKRSDGTFGSVLRWTYDGIIQILGYANGWKTSDFITVGGGGDIYVGSQLLYDKYLLTPTDLDRVNLITAYGESLISGLFDNNTLPLGYRKAYRLSAQVRTGGANYIDIGFNGRALISHRTWSDDYYRVSRMSQKFYSWEEFPVENSFDYTTRGLNLYIKQYGDSPNKADVYNITIHGYFEKIV